MKSSECFQLVMIVDDNEIDTLVSSKMIELTQFATQTIQFYSAQQALNYLNESAHQPTQIPDLIFLDINMPEMDGFEFLSEFEALPTSLKDKCNIIVLSSSDAISDTEKALSYKWVINFKSKPLQAKSLQELKEDLISQG